jgi:putative spermidine/putrescine transport system ATP-binding protein
VSTAATSAGIPIAVESVGKTFPDGTQALRPVSISIHAGEQLAILGPSGCGKTTLLRIIAGLEQPDASGRVLFDGRDVTSLPIEKRNVGMVFQSYALFPNMSVLENVGYGLRVRGIAKQERNAEAARVLGMVRMGDLAHRRIDQLSGGQRQRVALARALAVKPGVLLLDEPLTALDAALREELRAEIDGLLRSLCITTIYVTHDQAEAMVLGDRVIVMEKGGIAQTGSPRQIYFEPASTFVAGFIGNMNRIDGRITGGALVCPAGQLPVRAADCASASVRFRPESAEIVPAGQGSLSLDVERVHFLGATQRVYLRHAESGLALIVDASNRHDLVAGARVGLVVDPLHLIML